MFSILAIQLGFSAVVLAVLFIFPAMEPVAEAYKTQFVEFVSILVTSSSLLLGFAFTAETVLSSLTHNASRKSRAVSRIKWVKQVGLVCLLLSIAALLLNGESQTYFADLALVTAILALIVEVGLVAAFVT